MSRTDGRTEVGGHNMLICLSTWELIYYLKEATLILRLNSLIKFFLQIEIFFKFHFVL